MSGASFAAADWGTSNVRIWLFGEDGSVLGERRSADGMATASGRWETVLEDHLAALGAPAGLPVVVCGMAGARQGWVDAGYAFAPTRLDRLHAAAVAAPSRRRVLILPGVAQRDPADVMRGEETQIAGAGLGDGRQRVCMPGTHSKWVDVEDGAVTGFATAMTGEMFSVLSTQSILRHSLGDAPADAGSAAFADGVRLALERPAALTTHLFRIRPAGLLGMQSQTDAASRLSGLLLGAEIAGAGGKSGDRVTLVASGSLAELYGRGLSLAGIEARLVDADCAVRAGLLVAGRALFTEPDA